MVVVVFATLVGKRLPFAIWSPVYGIPAVYLILGTSGYLYYTFSSNYQGGFYDIGVSPAQAAQGFRAFLVAINAFLIGVLVYALSSRRLSRVIRSRSRSRGLQRRYALPSQGRKLRVSSLTIVILSLPIVLVIVGNGFENVLWRSQYLVEQYHYIGIAGSLLSMPAALALGFLTPAKKSRFWQAMCVGLVALYFLVLLSLSTRRIVVIFLFYLLGLALGGARRRTIVSYTVVWAISIPLLLQVPLELRGMPEQGLMLLPANLSTIFSQNPIYLYAEMVDTALRNLAFGVPLAGYVKNVYPIPGEALLISLNPLPSFVPLPGLPSWDDIQPQLRVGSYIPYNAIGELLNHGWLWLFLYYLVVGAIACWADVGVRAFEGRRGRWGFLVACGLLFYFSISSTQYNLRSATRYVYYAVAIILLWRLLCKVRLTLRQDRSTRSVNHGANKQRPSPSQRS